MLDIDGLGKRTEVETDDGLFQPLAGWRR